MPNFFQYKKGKYSVIPGKRPANQSKPAVLEKIKNRLERLIAENPQLRLTSLQKKFIEEIESERMNLKVNKIDIAHNIAISVIMSAIARRMNKPSLNKRKEDKEFIEDLLSSDDDVGKMEVREFLKNLADPDIKPKDKIAQANEVVQHLNRASKNLMPGHRATNRSIGSHRDPHLVKKKKKFVEIPHSSKLATSANTFLKDSYSPKTRTRTDGAIMYQSSSVSSSPENAFFKPRSIKSTTAKDKREAQMKQLYKKGADYLDRVYIEEEKGKDLLESRNYEKLCELIDYLEKNDKSRIYYQMLAAQVSELQQAVNNNERYTL